MSVYPPYRECLDRSGHLRAKRDTNWGIINPTMPLKVKILCRFSRSLLSCLALSSKNTPWHKRPKSTKSDRLQFSFNHLVFSAQFLSQSVPTWNRCLRVKADANFVVCEAPFLPRSFFPRVQGIQKTHWGNYADQAKWRYARLIHSVQGSQKNQFWRSFTYGTYVCTTSLERESPKTAKLRE